MTRYADSPAVILYHEHHRSPEDTRKVQRFIEIALGRCSIATHSHGHRRIASDLCSHTQPHRMRHLRPDHNLDGQTARLFRIGRGETTEGVDHSGKRNTSNKDRCDLTI